MRQPSIRRPRLLEYLHERFSKPVIVVIAPAGMGKTTLLAQAVTENRLAPRGTDHWITCSTDDATGASLADALCQVLGVPMPNSPRRAVLDVTEAIWHRAPNEEVLILDDVQEIPVGSSGADALAMLLSGLPRNGHVVLSSRQPPPVPLSRLEVQGQVVRLTEDDLLFNEAELAGFAAQRDVAASLLSESGGWPAMAELAASAMSGIEAAYLWEEVLAGIEPTDRHDLALLAHVGPFDNQLAEAVLGGPTDVDSLTARLPLVAKSTTGDYSIHPLWRPYLAREVSQAEIATARRRAGGELARSGDLAGAVRLLSDACAWDEVTNVVTDILASPDPPIPGDVVAAWLGRLPDEMTDGSLARLLRAVADVQTNPATAMRNLEDSANAFRDEGNPTGELACMAQLAQLAWWSEQPQRLAGLAARLFEIEALGYEKAFPLACLGRALIADVTGDCALVLAELDRIPVGSLSDTSLSLVDWLRSTSLNYLGRSAEALEAATSACAKANPLYSPVVESARIQARWFLGEVDDVVRELPGLVDRTADTGLRDFSALMSAISCIAFAAVGQVEDAARYLERARSAAASPDLALVDVNLVLAEVVLAVAEGDEPKATWLLRDYLERSSPLGTGLAAFAQRRTLPLWYVLLPETRHLWDGSDLGPTSMTARELARALVAVRTTGRPPSQSPLLPDPGITRSHLPFPWAVELALGHITADSQAGWTLLETLWPRAQPVVRRHVDDPGAQTRRGARAALAHLPVPPPSRFELRLLGAVELRRDGEFVDAPEWRRERVRALVAYLVLHSPVSRRHLADELWPDLVSDAQLRNLRVTLTHLLRVLEPDRAERDASFIIRTHAGKLLLHRGEWFETDIWRFDDLWHAATNADGQADPTSALAAIQQAVALWHNDNSELANEVWAVAELEQRRVRFVRLAIRASELLLARGNTDTALEMGHAALRIDPWSERAHQMVIAVHGQAGDDRAMGRALELYRAAMSDLGIDPSVADRFARQRSQPHAR